jgi:hypothetical protein
MESESRIKKKVICINEHPELETQDSRGFPGGSLLSSG